MCLSGVVHLGSRTSRHFITFLKACNPPCWYELDDEKPAEVHTHLPAWAKERLVLIWFCPATCALDTSLKDFAAASQHGVMGGSLATEEPDLNCRPLGRHMKTLMINSAFRRCFLASPLRWLPLPLALRRRLDLPLDLLLPPCLTWAAEQLPADVKLLRDTDRGSSSCKLILPILTG